MNKVTKSGSPEESLRANSNGQATEPVVPEVQSTPVSPGEEVFELDDLVCRQDYDNLAPVDRPIRTVPIRPINTRGKFIRVHPEPAYSIAVPLVESQDETDNELYLIHGSLQLDLENEPEIRNHRLYVCLSLRSRNPFLIAVKMAGPDGKLSTWSRSAFAALDKAKTTWSRIFTVRETSSYRDEPSKSKNLPEPVWPSISMRDLVNLAFKDRIITSWNHPILKQYRGEE
jgi:hypothetical protein